MKNEKITLASGHVRRSFSGGVHPPEHKITSAQKIIDIPPPKRVILPLIQHLGAPSKSLVSVGEAVKRGQKIADATGNVSAPVHASISGKVSALVPWIHPTLLKPVESMVIDSDGLDADVSPNTEFSDYVRHSPLELRKVVLESGIVGLGGACFPTHIKLNPPKDNFIDYLIVTVASVNRT